ncbi:NERD domain-containing protein, partial [Sulfurovum sp. bin170]|uniref:NERD domain-containing protein n=1 Tax=Sulfurovum sp. bin170 TaxID=2695268 RepID=UPI0013E0525D
QLSKNPKQQALIRADLSRVENGYQAEKDNAYYLDFRFKDNPRNILLHDIRIEHNGKTAQIDHIIINRLGIEVLESKSFTGTLSIKGDGSLNVKYGQKTQTFPNPIEQNKRHAEILANFIKENMELPANIKLLGIPISSTVLINPKTTMGNDTLPKGFDRADSFSTHWNESVDKMSTLTVFKTLGSIMSFDKVKKIADLLLNNHNPRAFDYIKKYPIRKEKKPQTVKQVEPIKSVIKESISISNNLNSTKTTHCSKCQDTNIEIRYGKYGYYFKCLSCDGNTSMKLTCSSKSCKPKLKKSKLNFHQVCEVCGLNELFFTNPNIEIKV